MSYPYLAASLEWRRVFVKRAEAFGTGRPVHDWDRSQTYMPDGRVVPMRRSTTLAPAPPTPPAPPVPLDGDEATEEGT